MKLGLCAILGSLVIIAAGQSSEFDETRKTLAQIGAKLDALAADAELHVRREIQRSAWDRAIAEWRESCPAVRFDGLEPGRYMVYIKPKNDQRHVWYVATLIVDQSGARLVSGVEERDLPDSVARLGIEAAAYAPAK